MSDAVYRLLEPGIQVLAPSRCSLPRHRHSWGHATVVLAGAFVEASFAGRFAVRPGDVLLHGPFDCHANAPTSLRGIQYLRLPWWDLALEGHFRVRDADALAATAERDVSAAMRELSLALEPGRSSGDMDWPEQLAAELSRGCSVPLAEWASARSLAPETISRGFRRAFGVSPQRFRLEARARAAWRRVVGTCSRLTDIAHDLGFADQAHMSRSVGALTGHAPSAWRETLAACFAEGGPGRSAARGTRAASRRRTTA